MNYHIISLGNRPGSYSQIVQAAGIGPVQNITTVDGKLLSDFTWERDGYKVEMMPNVWKPKYGELGVWHSQLNAWAWALGTSEPLIILEDDVIVQDGWLEKVTDVMNELPESWDFLSLAYSKGEMSNINRVGSSTGDLGATITFRPQNRGRFSPPERNGFYVDGFQTWQAVAWAISPKGASKALSLMQQEGVVLPVDLWVHYRVIGKALEGYAIDPNRLCIQADLLAETTIHHTDTIE